MGFSKLSFLVWYKMMFLMSAAKKGFSVKKIQTQSGLKRYGTFWGNGSQTKNSDGKSRFRYSSQDMIEFDGAYFSIAESEIEKSGGIRGKEAKGKQNAGVFAESIPLEDPETVERSKFCG